MLSKRTVTLSWFQPYFYAPIHSIRAADETTAADQKTSEGAAAGRGQGGHAGASTPRGARRRSSSGGGDRSRSESPTSSAARAREARRARRILHRSKSSPLRMAIISRRSTSPSAARASIWQGTMIRSDNELRGGKSVHAAGRRPGAPHTERPATIECPEAVIFAGQILGCPGVPRSQGVILKIVIRPRTSFEFRWTGLGVYNSLAVPPSIDTSGV